jgi:hypothetical protein
MSFADSWLSFKRFWYKTFFRLPLYRFWIHFTRLFIDRGEKQPVPVFTAIEDLNNHRKVQKYKPDDLRDWFDSVHSAEWIQANLGKIEHGYDCDDHASWLVRAIKQSKGKMTDCSPIKDAFFMYVGWPEGAHMVCLIEWAEGAWSFMDYGLPSPMRGSIEEVVQQVTVKYSASRTVLGWAIFDEQFHTIRVGNL